MSETKDPSIPLPDPDRVQERVDAAIAKFRERPGLYIGIGAAFILIVAGVIFAINYRSSGRDASKFTPLWLRAEAVKDRLAIDLSAKAELEELEAYREKIRGTEEEGLALWFLAIYHYREAYTEDKHSFEMSKPHLEKAKAYLQELQAEQFDGLLLAKANWYTSSSRTPIDRLVAQVDKDLAYGAANAYTEPAPDDAVVAVLRTSEGDVMLHFFSKLAPEHTKNFLTLARKGTYNGTNFYYVSGEPDDPKSVMGGDPYSFFYNNPLKKDHILRWGKGGVGYGLPPEEARFRVNHLRGIVTSQRVPKADWDNAVQFQILTGAGRNLDRVHTPFAKVVEGMDVIDRIASRKRASEHGPYKDDYQFSGVETRNLIVDPVVIHKVIVFENGKVAEHDFPLEEGEKSLATLKDTKAQALPPDTIRGERKLVPADAENVRRGLDIPFPKDVDAEKADPFGEYKPVWKSKTTPPKKGDDAEEN